MSPIQTVFLPIAHIILLYARLRNRFTLNCRFYCLKCQIITCTKEDRHSREYRSLESGDFLSSRAVSSQVLSAFGVLTSVFGMGTGGTLQLSSPEIVFSFCLRIFKTAQVRSSFPVSPSQTLPFRTPSQPFRTISLFFPRSSPRPISITKLHTLPHFHR